MIRASFCCEMKKSPRRRQRRKSKDSTKTSFNLLQQFYFSAVICTLSFSSFLPFMLGMEIYDDDEDIPYSGAADNVLLAITNAVLVACTLMMVLEALLDSNTLYLPIKVVFPRFIMVVGVLFVSLTLYFQPLEGLDRLSFFSCMLQAEGYFICGGLMLKLIKDNAKHNFCKWCFLIVATIVSIADMQLHRWAAYYPETTSFTIIQGCVSFCTLIIGTYLFFRTLQLSVSKHWDDSGHHAYVLMSYLTICVYGFGTYSVSLYFGRTRWKDSSAEELAAYMYVSLSALVLFFFTSSHIAQRAFVLAKVSIY
jgi:hypothetical protein